MRLTTSEIIPGQFVLFVLIIEFTSAIQVFLKSSTDFMLSMILIPIFILSFAVLLIHMLLRPKRRKLLFGGIAIVTAISGIFIGPILNVAGAKIFYLYHQAEMDSFANEIVTFGRIHNLSINRDGSGNLNGEYFVENKSQTEESGHSEPSPARLLEEVLSTNSIDRKKYEDFKRRLNRINMESFDLSSGYVAFIHGGIIDNLRGFVYITNVNLKPVIGTEFLNCKLVFLKHLRGQWYWFGTT